MNTNLRAPLVTASLAFGSVLLFTPACETPFSAGVGEEERYLAHLELDSTVLIATTVADGLEVPWDVAWGADGRLWFTEQNGTVHRLDPETGKGRIVLRVPGVHYQKSRGLLGMALHPQLPGQPYVYLHYTYFEEGDERSIRSRLVRYTLRGDTLLEPRTLLDRIPGNTYHNGSRLTFTADGRLLLATGDAGAGEAPLDRQSLAGKILRLNPDGSIPADNPLPGSPVWSWGHRNPQGLVALPDGRLYASEHGPATDDEVNRILPGRNYGWPRVHGYCDRENERAYCDSLDVVEPLRAWTPTVAAAGLDYYDHPAIPEWRNCLLLANLKGQALRVLPLSADGDRIPEEHIFFQLHFGRLRDVCVAPNGDVYLATSNRDWHPRYQPFLYDTAALIRPGDDRIIRLRAASPAGRRALARLPHPVALRENPEAAALGTEDWNLPPPGDALATGAALYQTQCAPCHRPDGKGIAEMAPPLAASAFVTGDKERLIALLMHGQAAAGAAAYQQDMPAFAGLADEELAAVLTFIRQSWGNTAGAVQAAEVKEERKAMAGAQ